MRINLASIGLLFASPALSQERFVVGYFNEWPLPAQYGRQTGAFDQALGLTVEWEAFSNSYSLIDAVASGQVQIGLSVGVTPIIEAKRNGKSIQIIDIAVSYPMLENCVTRPRLGITRENPSELENIRIGLPIGTSVHFNLIKYVETLGLDIDHLDLVNMSPREASAAYANNTVDGACAWGASLSRLEENGSKLLPETISEDGNISGFDALISEDFYAKANQDKIVSFLRVINDINEDFETYPDPILTYLPALVNLSTNDVGLLLNYFEFLTLDSKLSNHWLEGGVQQHLQEISAFYVQQATIDEVPENLDSLVNPAYLHELQEILSSENALSEQQEDDPETRQNDAGELAD